MPGRQPEKHLREARMKITIKLMALFALTFIISISIIGAFFYSFSEKHITEHISAHLQTTAQSRAEHAIYFLEEQEDKLELLATEPTFLNFIKADKGDPDYEMLLEDVNRRIRDIDKGIGIFSPEGIVLAAENNPPGTDYSDTPFFHTAMNRTEYLMYYDIARKNYNIGVIKPVIDKSSGELIGVIGFDVHAGGLFEITTDTTGLGKTGKAYIINKDNLMITPSRFQEAAVFSQKVNTEKAEQCYNKSMHLNQENAGPPSTYYDYMGKKVLGTYYYIPHTRWCLLAEINLSEAFDSLDILRRNILVLSLVVLAVGLIIFFLAAGTITNPITRLTEHTRRIRKGNLNKKCEINSHDEIGELAQTFDKMRLGIKDRNDLLESLLSSFKGKFGNLATIIARKNIEKLVKKNPRTEKILPKSLKKTIKKSKRIKKSKSKDKDIKGTLSFFKEGDNKNE